MKPDARALRSALRIAGVFAVLAFLVIDIPPVRAIFGVVLVGLATYWIETRDWEALSAKRMAGLSALILAFWAAIFFIGRNEEVGWLTWLLLAAIIALPAGLLVWSLLRWRKARRLDRNGAWPTAPSDNHPDLEQEENR